MGEVKNVPLNDKHIALGAKMMPFAGFNMPVRYSSDKEEHLLVRNGVGVFDVSHMGEFLVEGKQAADLIQYVTSNDVTKLTPGKIQYSCFPTEEGGIVDDLLVYKYSDEKFMLVVNAGNIDKDFAWVTKNNSFDCTVTNQSDDYALFAVQGPKAIEALQSLTSVKLSEQVYYTFTTGDFAGLEGIILSATGYTGAGGFEIYVPAAKATLVWDKIFEAGESLGIQPVGLGARDTLRLEKGYCLYGNDIDDTTSALEGGLGWITKLDTDFIGKDFLITQKEEGLKRKLVAFKITEKGIPRAGYELLSLSEENIGKVTSGSISPVTGEGIGLAYVSTEFTKVGTEILVAIRNKKIKAEVVKLPFV